MDDGYCQSLVYGYRFYVVPEDYYRVQRVGSFLYRVFVSGK